MNSSSQSEVHPSSDPLLDLSEQLTPGDAPLAVAGTTAAARPSFSLSHCLAALNTLGSSVIDATSADEVFDEFLAIYPPMLSADHMMIYLNENCQEGALEVAAGTMEQEVSIQLERQLSPLLQKVIGSHQSVRLNRTEVIEQIGADAGVMVAIIPLSLLLTPLIVEQECAGIVIACAESIDAFTHESLQAMIAGSHWLASCLRHQEQQKGLQRRLDDLDALATINRVISETVELEEVLQLIVDSAGEIVCECDWAVLHLINDKTQQLEPAVTYGLSLQPAEYRLALDDGIIGNVFQSGTYINVADLQEDERRLQFDMVIQSRSMLVAPLKNKEETIGTLSVQCATPGTYTEADERLLTTLGLQAFVAIKNARLFNAQRKAYSQAEMLRNITADLGRSLEPDSVFLTLRRSLNKVFDYQYAFIMLLQEQTRYISLHICCDEASTGWSVSETASDASNDASNDVGSDVDTLPCELDLGAAPELQQLIEERSVLIIDDVEKDDRWRDQPWFLPGLHSWLAAPMVAQDEVIGLFWVGRKIENGFSADDEQVLAESLASAAASALQNTNLHMEVQRASARLRRLNHMVLTAQEEERLRIARELHDESGQALSALTLNLNLASQEIQRQLTQENNGAEASGEIAAVQLIEEDAEWLEKVHKRLTGAVSMVELTTERIRDLTHNLRPPLLSTLGLNATLEGLCQDFVAQTGIQIRYHGTKPPALPNIITISFYRILQEALANVAKHAEAESVAVSLRCKDEQIQLTITDDGRGFLATRRLDSPSSGIGLLGMNERCEMLSGTLEIQSQYGAGTTIKATVPLVPVAGDD